MTKAQIVAEITKRAGDPSALAYGSDVWNYFIESLYELIPQLNENEKRYLTVKTQTYSNTDSKGLVYIPQGEMDKWNDLYGINVDGYPSRSIDRDEFYKIMSNEFYYPVAPESYYIFDADKLVLMTGSPSSYISVELWFLFDPQDRLGSAVDADSININSSLVYRAIPLAANKLKVQAGLTL